MTKSIGNCLKAVSQPIKNNPKRLMAVLGLTALAVGIAAYLGQLGQIPHLNIPAFSISGPEAVLAGSALPLAALLTYMGVKKCCCKAKDALKDVEPRKL